MAYEEQVWVNGPGGGTPLVAARLQHMESGIKDASNRIDELEANGGGGGAVSSVNGQTGAVSLGLSELDDVNVSGAQVGGVSALRKEASGGFTLVDALTPDAADGRYGRIPAPCSRPPATLLYGAQTGHSLTVLGSPAASNLADTSDYLLGTQAVSLTTTTTAGVAGFRRDSINPALDMTGKGFVIWLKVDDFTKLSYLDIQVITNAGSDIWDKRILDGAGSLPGADGTGRIVESGEWVSWYVPFSAIMAGNTTGTPNRAAVTGVRVRAFNLAGQAATLRCGGIGTYPESTAGWLANGVVSFTYDDVWATQITAARPHLDRYAYRATLYPIQSLIGAAGRLTLAQLRSLHDDYGWEVGGHATSEAVHDSGIPVLTQAQRLAELRAVRAWQVANGFGDCAAYAYPRGRWSRAAAADVAAAGFASARTVNGALPEIPGTPYPYRLRSVTATGLSAAQLQAEVDKAKTSKAWTIFTFHGVVAALSDSQDTLAATHSTLVDYVASSGVAVRPVGEVMQAAFGLG